MVKNYFKVAFRNLLKNPLSTIINMLGLSAGVACCFVAYSYIHLEYHMESMHSNKERIFMVTSFVDRGGSNEWYGVTPTPIGLKMKEDFPQITHLARVEDKNVVVQRDENTFHEWARMVDPDYLKMFDFDIVKGNKSALKDRNSVVISTEMAEKYFAKDDPIGQTINMRFGTQNVPLKVTGVANIDEMTTSFGFNFLINIELLERVEPEFGLANWSNNINATMIMLDEPGEVETIRKKVKDYAAISNAAQPDWQISDFNFVPVSEIYFASNNIRWDISRNSDNEGHLVLGIIAFLLLLLACLNYLNIAITSAVKRLKEIGVRKVIGADRSRLVAQFMIENILISGIALGIGLLIGMFLFMPGLNNLFGADLGTREVLTLEFVLFVSGTLLLTAILSGAYPALYVSKFQVVSIFKGKTSFGKKNKMAKFFLTLEFIIASVAVSCGIIFTLNTNYQRNLSWGYDQESLLLMRFNNVDQLNRMESELAKIKSIESISASEHHVGKALSSSLIEFPSKKLEAKRMDVDESYLKTVGIEIKSGDPIAEYDKTGVLINESFVKEMGWENPIGETFRYDSTLHTVKGVVNDFHYYSFWNEIEPVFIRVAKEEKHAFLVIRTQPENTIPLYEEIEAKWTETFPDEPFSGEYQTQSFDNFFRNTNGHMVLMLWVAGIALLMTCLGLYGLVGLNISGRKKEFSIRKVLGAGNMSLARSVSSHFYIFLSIALILGIPISYFLVDGLLSMIYTYPMPLNFLPVIGSAALIVITIIVTILAHLASLVKQNPTEGLRVE